MGRRLGYTAQGGLVNEIPGALYSGDGQSEQFLVLDPLPGHYRLDVLGLGSDAVAILSTPSGDSTFHGNLPAGSSAAVQLNVATLVWKGTVNGVWDVNTTANFIGNPSGKFNNGDQVTFDDSGSNTAIRIAEGGVAPGSVDFSNTAAENYSLSGGPISGSASLVVSGGGHVTLSNANTYTGGTWVTSGTLEIASCDALPEGGTLTIGSGGTVILANGLSNVSRSPVPIPEPSTLALLAIGAVALLAYGWRRRKWAT
jgi:autotransporter-associated beta strand protein